MPTLVVKTNPAHGSDVTIGDMGVFVTSAGGTVTFTDNDDIYVAIDSRDLATLATDAAYGTTSTLILNDGTTDIAQADAIDFLSSLFERANAYVEGPTVLPADNIVPRWDGATGRLLQSSTWTLSDTGSVTMTGTSGSAHNFIVSSSNSGIQLRGNRNAGVGTADVEVNSTNTRTAGYLLEAQNNNTTAARIRFDGAVLPSAGARTSGIAQALVSGGVNHTGQTASTEAPFWHASTYTRTWATGAIATQREIRFDAPTYAAAAASVITDAANLYVGGAPIAGANVTITNNYALWVDSGVSRFDDSLLFQSYVDIQQIATPSDPPAGTRRMFVDSGTGKLSVRTSAGATVSLEETGGGGGGGGGGTTTVDFGSDAEGSQLADTAITGQASILTTSRIRAWVAGVATADHNVAEHLIVPVRVVIRDVVAGTGFTIQVISDWHLNGLFTVQWEWV
jgi:hypothetical protein